MIGYASISFREYWEKKKKILFYGEYYYLAPEVFTEKCKYGKA